MVVILACPLGYWPAVAARAGRATAWAEMDCALLKSPKQCGFMASHCALTMSNEC